MCHEWTKTSHHPASDKVTIIPLRAAPCALGYERIELFQSHRKVYPPSLHPRNPYVAGLDKWYLELGLVEFFIHGNLEFLKLLIMRVGHILL